MKKYIHYPLFVLTLLFVALFWSNNWLLLGLLTITSLSLLIINKSKKEHIMFVICAILGPLAEVFAIYFGAWSYSNPQIFGIPLWLSLVWGGAGLFFLKISDDLERYFKIK